MGNWNFDELENSLVSDAEKRIPRGYQKPSEQPPSGEGEGDNTITHHPSPNTPDIIGIKTAETKGVQTYLPLKDYMRLMQQKTLRKQNIAQIAGEAIIDWLDRQEQEGAK